MRSNGKLRWGHQRFPLMRRDLYATLLPIGASVTQLKNKRPDRDEISSSQPDFDEIGYQTPAIHRRSV